MAMNIDGVRQHPTYAGPERRMRAVDRRAFDPAHPDATQSEPRTQARSAVVPQTADIGAVVLAVFAGIGVTLLLVVFGLAVGLVTADEGTTIDGVTDVSAFVGWWAVGAALVGALVGGFLGGRASGLLGRATPAAHGAAAWGLSLLLLMGMTGVLSLSVFGAVTTDTIGDEITVIAVNDSGDAAWWAVAWLALSLVGSIGGWMLGAMRSPLGRRARDEVHAE